jgi:hypothetical protein
MRAGAESVLGVAWFAAGVLWGIVLGLTLVLFPLGAAIGFDRIVRESSPVLALGAGVAAAYLLGISPWDAEGRWSLPVVVAAAAAAWAGWNLLGRDAGPEALFVAVAVALAGWLLRRVLSARSPRATRP